MIQAQTTFQPIFEWSRVFTLEPYRALNAEQVQKVALVALSCFAFLSLQIGCSWAISAGIAVTSSLITFFSETFLRRDLRENVNWIDLSIFNRVGELRGLKIVVGFLLAHGFIGEFIPTVWGALPGQAVGFKILSGDLREIVMINVIGPVLEEFVFRGFIQERIEDMVTLVNRHVFRVENREGGTALIGLLGSSLLFGFLHITGRQILNPQQRFQVFRSTTIFGFFMGAMKIHHASLFSPIAAHCASNIGITLGMVVGRVIWSIAKC